MLILWLMACAAGNEPFDPWSRDGDDTAADTAAPPTPPELVWEGACPVGMAQVGAVCIDTFEATVTGDLGYADQLQEWPGTATTGWATSVEAVLPQVPTSWYQARGACINAGKRLCTVDEWQTTCGPGSFPWGEEPLPDAVCAVPAPDGTSAYDTIQPTGSLPECRTAEGVYDHLGNAWEWADPGTIDDAGVPRTAKMGGAYYAGPGNAGCHLDPITDHAPWFEGTVSARCCIDARE